MDASLRSTRLAANEAAHASPPPLPTPLLSSRARGWADVQVELHHFRGADVLRPMHDHLIGLHLSGSVNLLQARAGRVRTRHVRAGDVTVSSAGEPKRFAHTGENVVILVAVRPALVDAVAAEDAGIPRRVALVECDGAPNPALFALGQQLLGALGEGEASSRLRADTLARAIARQLLRDYASGRVLQARVPPTLAGHKLQRAIDYIDAHLHEDVTLAAIAGALSMSPGHFAHAFRGATGLPPHRFLVERRIERARALLRDTDLPITEIAHRIGCANPSHFSALFHRVTGKTPRDFRA